MTSLRVTAIGGPTVLLEFDGWRLLTDPTFDAPGRRYAFGWGTSSRKLVGPAISVAEMGPIDAVLLTHDHHADNLDTAGRSLLDSVPVVITTAAGAGRLGGSTRGLRNWESTQLQRPGRPEIEVTATPCRHGPPASRPIVGQVVGFALRWAGQANGSVWITGDTVVFDGVRLVPRRIRVGTAIVHLGAVRFPLTGPLRYTMNAAQAVELIGYSDATTVIPVHYDGWSHFSEPVDQARHALARLNDRDRARVQWPIPGVPLEVVA